MSAKSTNGSNNSKVDIDIAASSATPRECATSSETTTNSSEELLSEASSDEDPLIGSPPEVQSFHQSDSDSDTSDESNENDNETVVSNNELKSNKPTIQVQLKIIKIRSNVKMKFIAYFCYLVLLCLF